MLGQHVSRVTKTVAGIIPQSRLNKSLGDKVDQYVTSDPLQWTSEASEILCLGDNVLLAARSTSTLTMFFLF